MTEILYETHTAFQHVRIEQHPQWGKLLRLDGLVHSSENDKDLYHQDLVRPAFSLKPDIRRALVLGGGEGATIREVLQFDSVEEAVMVDIDEELVNICQEGLPSWSNGAFKDPRLRLYFEDAARFMEKDKSKYDLAVWDVCDPDVTTPSNPLYTDNFFNQIKKHLMDDGLLALEYSPRNTAIFKRLTEGWQELAKTTVFIPCFEEDWVFQVLRNS